MEKVAVFTIIFSTALFTLGLLAPRKSLKFRKEQGSRPCVVTDVGQEENEINSARYDAAMRMASAGVTNVAVTGTITKEINLAANGSTTR